MFLQLNPPIPLETPKGKAWAVALIDYGPQWDLQWITFINGTGECWTFTNRDIRQEENFTFGIPKPSPIGQKKMPVLNGNERKKNGLNGHTSPANGHDHAIAHDYSELMRPANGLS